SSLRPPSPILFLYTTLFRSSGTLSEEELRKLQTLLDDTSILFDDDGSVLYSNGLYSPPVNNGVPIGENVPRYVYVVQRIDAEGKDRKSTRLNSSHVKISYAV